MKVSDIEMFLWFNDEDIIYYLVCLFVSMVYILLFVNESIEVDTEIQVSTFPSW